MYLNNLTHVEILQIHTSFDDSIGFASKKYGCIQRSCVNLDHVYF